MKLKWTILYITFLVLLFSIEGFSQIIYSNSFESPLDTIGWMGFMEFRNEAPPGGGNQSVFISGGCIWPHAWIEIGPFNESSSYIIRCWGKDLQIGGGVSIYVEGEYSNQVNINVNGKEWKYYTSENSLFCPAGKKIIIAMGAGGIVASAILIDEIELVKVGEINTWIIRNSGSTEKLNDAVMLNGSTAIVVGKDGAILKTTDSGKTWRNTAPPVYCANGMYCIMSWNSISFYDSLNGIVVGNEILITTDGGEEWQFHSIPANHELLCSNYMERNHIYVGDDSGYVYQSVDTGKTWLPEKLADEPIKSIFFYAAPFMSWRPVYVLTSHSVYSTKTSSYNGWKEEKLPITTWGAAVKGNNCKWGDPAFIVGYDGQLATSPLILRKTYTDSAWQKYPFSSPFPVSSIGSLNDVSVPALNVAYTCGDNGLVMKTSDKGDTWFMQETGTSRKLNAIYFYNESKGIAAGDSGTILFTSTETSETNYPPSPFHLISPEDEDTIWSIPKSISFTWQEAVDSNKDIINYTLLISADSGATWKSFGPVTGTTCQVQWPNEVSNSERYFWTVIANDGILATPSFDVFAFTIITITGANENEYRTPAEFILHQNYPNPFNPSTKIKYEIPIEEHISLKIYDLLGKEIITLADGIRKAGKHEVEWNPGNLSSGIYFYILRAGHYSSTKKLILLK
jgi:hypothetical protein